MADLPRPGHGAARRDAVRDLAAHGGIAAEVRVIRHGRQEASMSVFRPFLRCLMAAAVAVSAAACASTQVAEEDRLPGEIADPLETLNRHIFAVNLTLDTFILRPAAVGYREIVPDVGKTAVRNFVNNLKSPITLIHDLAQGEW